MAPKRKAAPRAPSPSSSHSEGSSDDGFPYVEPVMHPMFKKRVLTSQGTSSRDQESAKGEEEGKTKPAAKKAPAPKTKNEDASPFPQPDDPPEYPEMIHKNKEFPTCYTLPPKTGDVKITAWNITSIKSACDPKNGGGRPGMMDYILQEDADIVILTETKRNDMAPIPQDKVLREKYPFQKWANSNKKGYAGTAILSKIKPISTEINLTITTASGHQQIMFGRIAIMEFPSLFVIGTYVPNSGEDFKSLPQREAWNEAFEAKTRELEARKPVVWGGDINVVASGNDISDAVKKWNRKPGWSSTELEGFRSQLAVGLYDVWRDLKGPNLVQYSFHSKLLNQRQNGKGWRLDTFVASEKLRERVVACEIRSECFGPSDHVPVVLELKGQL